MAKRKGRIWTIEERQKQAERIRSQKPWLKSTGPRTKRGKLTSSQNAMKHGCYGAEFKQILAYLRLQKHYIDTLRFMLKRNLFEEKMPSKISGNELNENSTKSIQNDTIWRDKIVIRIGFSAPKNSHPSVIARNEMTKQSIMYLHTYSGLLRKARNDNRNKKAHPFGRAFGNFQSGKIIQRQLFSLLPFS